MSQPELISGYYQIIPRTNENISLVAFEPPDKQFGRVAADNRAFDNYHLWYLSITTGTNQFTLMNCGTKAATYLNNEGNSLSLSDSPNIEWKATPVDNEGHYTFILAGESTPYFAALKAMSRKVGATGVITHLVGLSVAEVKTVGDIQFSQDLKTWKFVPTSQQA